MGEYKIAVVAGDGIGPEITAEAVRVLKVIGEKFNHKFDFDEVYAGGAAIDKFGEALPEESLKKCLESDAVLLGAVGGPKWDGMEGSKRPERALLGIRENLGLYVNLRPATVHKALSAACPLKDEITGDGFDIMVVRELTGGIYFGERGYRQGKYGNEAFDVEAYSEMEIERIARFAFDAAMKRNKNLTSVDKANVLETSRLWRKIVTEVAKDYPEVTLTHMYVDNAAMQLVRNPRQFDVIVTSNMFGDILSDEASQITGSIGMLPSASMGKANPGMYEPIHGSAPDIAGENKANPIATILSVAMMLRYSFGLMDEAEAIEAAVTRVLDKGFRTPDIMSDGMTLVGTKEMGDAVLAEL